MLEVSELRKEYDTVTAVDGVSFTTGPGVFGLLGPNGAGKSTAIGCISGLLTPSSGSVKVMGFDVARQPREAKRSLGIVPQELALYEDLSPVDNLGYWAEAYGISGADRTRRVDEVLARIGLTDRARSPVKTFSGGMKRRLNFGCGIVHHPKVLLLDEPTVGVDPQSRVGLLDLVKDEVARGTCVVYTTHYMEEAQELCDRLAIIDHGKVIAEGTLAELRELLGERDVLQLKGAFDPDAVRSLALDAEIVAAETDAVILAVVDASRKLAEIFDALAGAGSRIDETSLKQPNLESLFIKLTGRQLRE